MAETKAKTKTKAAKPKARSSAKPKRTRSSSKPKTKAASKPQVVKAVEETAKDAGHKVKDAGQKVGHVAGKAKVPLMAGGAALAGAAGGLALGARQSHRHRGIGVNSDGLTKAAKKVGGFGMHVGELALEGQRARQASNGKAHRSPIEVVLQGLTSRQSRG
jgi:hypothetical protein